MGLKPTAGYWLVLLGRYIGVWHYICKYNAITVKCAPVSGGLKADCRLLASIIGPLYWSMAFAKYYDMYILMAGTIDYDSNRFVSAKRAG